MKISTNGVELFAYRRGSILTKSFSSESERWKFFRGDVLPTGDIDKPRG